MKSTEVTGAMLNKRFYLRNLAVWGGLYGLSMLAQLLAYDKTNKDYHPYLQTTLTILGAMAIFYMNFFLCNTLFVRRKALYWLSLAGITVLLFLLTRGILQRNNAESGYSESRITTITLSVMMYFVILVLISSFYWSTLFAAQKMKENAVIQLKFLQSQVNPHFLHNTLNFLYAKSLKGSPELSDGIMTLSNIMKYALQKNENGNGLVLLEDEVAHLENVIHIHQLRFAGQLNIEFTRTGPGSGVEILPFILITLVENALKHGQLEDTGCPIRICLRCDVEDQQLYFSVINCKREGPKELGTGIGLENAIRRLKDAYGPAGSLTITEDRTHFKAELTIPLHKSQKSI